MSSALPRDMPWHQCWIDRLAYKVSSTKEQCIFRLPLSIPLLLPLLPPPLSSSSFLLDFSKKERRKRFRRALRRRLGEEETALRVEEEVQKELVN
jgi:hypothetical protein